MLLENFVRTHAAGVPLLLAGLWAANTAQATPVVVDFTATVTQTSGLTYGDVATGSMVTGELFIDYAAALDYGNQPPIGSAANWTASSNGGTYYGSPLPDAEVFASDITVGSHHYVSAFGSTTYQSLSTAQSQSAGLVFTLGESNYTTSDRGTGSVFVFNNAAAGQPPFDSSGVPIFTPYNDTGGFYSTFGLEGIGFTLTSLTVATSPVPLPGSLWLLVAGVGFHDDGRNEAPRRAKMTSASFIDSSGVLRKIVQISCTNSPRWAM